MNGRYRAAYTGPDRELYRAPMTFRSKDDAIAWLSARRAEIDFASVPVIVELSVEPARCRCSNWASAGTFMRAARVGA